MASAVYAGFSFLFYVIGNNTIMFPGYKSPPERIAVRRKILLANIRLTVSNGNIENVKISQKCKIYVAYIKIYDIIYI